MSPLHEKNKALSLTESVTIIAIVGALAAIFAPVVAKARSGPDYGNKFVRAGHDSVAHAIYLQDYDRFGLTDPTPLVKGVARTRNSNYQMPMANQMRYHNGPVMLGTVGIYYIWYGNWSGNTATTILTDLASNIGGSPYWNINTTYYQGSTTKSYISNSVAYRGSTTDNYSQGTTLSDAGVQAVVSSAISSGRLPKDTNAIYMVLTSQDVAESSGFCTQYCGWHTRATISGSDVKYAFIGNAARCITACGAQSTGPNGNAGADAMASIIAHEAEEAATDPDLNAWYTNRGQENADICAWTFGTTSTASNGSKYNVTFGARQFLIQQNYKNAGSGGCTMQYP